MATFNPRLTGIFFLLMFSKLIAMPVLALLSFLPSREGPGVCEILQSNNKKSVSKGRTAVLPCEATSRACPRESGGLSTWMSCGFS